MLGPIENQTVKAVPGAKTQAAMSDKSQAIAPDANLTDTTATSGTDQLLVPQNQRQSRLALSDAFTSMNFIFGGTHSAESIQDDLAPVVILTAPPPLVKGTSFRSWGDPHEVSGDGLKFDNQKTGTFIAFRSTDGDLELQKYQEKDEQGRWAGATLNKAAGLKVGANTISYDIRGNELRINGISQAVRPGAVYPLEGGGSLSVSADGQNLDILSAKGDRIRIERKDGYIDFSGDISATRVSRTVYGSIGCFDADADAGNDLILPDGSVYQVTHRENHGAHDTIVEDQAHVDRFLEQWRVASGNSLIPTRS